MENKSIIISAGGVGKRMGAVIPKQFLLLNNRPVLMRTIDRFVEYDPTIQIIVVLSANQLDYWKALCVKYKFNTDHILIKGGKERFHSVQNGLKAVTGTIVGVHDAVRPLIAVKVIENCFNKANQTGAALPAIAMRDSVRMILDNGSKAVDRKDYKLVQTPQCFRTEILKNAYKAEFLDLYTDDASVVESTGQLISIIEGNSENIKITEPIDLKLAELLLNEE